MTIALEPEAASVYCRYLPLEATNQEQSSAISDFQVGTKYMVIDAGGEFEHMYFLNVPVGSSLDSRKFLFRY